EDGIRDFHVTGVQTCALPIFVGSLVDADIGGLCRQDHGNQQLERRRVVQLRGRIGALGFQARKDFAAFFPVHDARTWQGNRDYTENRRAGANCANRGARLVPPVRRVIMLETLQRVAVCLTLKSVFPLPAAARCAPACCHRPGPTALMPVSLLSMTSSVLPRMCTASASACVMPATRC